MDETGDMWLHVGAGVAFAPDTLQPLLMAPLFNLHNDRTYERNDSVWALWGTNIAEKVKKYKDTLRLYTFY